MHSLHLAELAEGQQVLVLGSGSMGLMVVMAARAAGAGEVVATYRHQHQGQGALAAGAHRIVAADQDRGEDLAAEVRRRPPDLVVETIGGGSGTLQQAVNVVRPGGRIAVLGLSTRAVSLSTMALMLKEARITSGVTYCRRGRPSDFEVALGIVQSDPERLRGTITHRFPLDRVAEAFETAADKTTLSLKVVVNP